MITMYGIPNCDTIKKAKTWLDKQGVTYAFHNYKKDGVDKVHLSTWVEQLGWETLLNKRGTTWRKLPDEQKQDIDRQKAIALMCDYPSMIKRPVLVIRDKVEVGFNETRYLELTQNL